MSPTAKTDPAATAPRAAADLPVHVFRTGTLTGNRTFLRADGWSALLRRAEPYPFPALCFVIEHPEGLIAIDAGMTVRARRPWHQRRFVPRPAIRPEDEIGPQMRRHGLDPAEVRTVVVTHLDWDHVGGVGHFPGAEVLVHRPELDFAGTRLGRTRYRPQVWPDGFRPAPYDLDDVACGPFPRSRAVTRAGDVAIVPLPGHSIGQVGVVVRAGAVPLLFCADHVLRQDWLVEDLAADRLHGLGLFFRDQAEETTRRLVAFVRETPTVLVPSHDADAPARVRAREPLALAR